MSVLTKVFGIATTSLGAVDAKELQRGALVVMVNSRCRRGMLR